MSYFDNRHYRYVIKRGMRRPAPFVLSPLFLVAEKGAQTSEKLESRARVNTEAQSEIAPAVETAAGPFSPGFT
jgi:hypothetical protein